MRMVSHELLSSHNGIETSSNPILAWHGTKEENISSISQDGFKLLAQKDSGWYGKVLELFSSSKFYKGIYFTQLPNYVRI